MPTEIASLYASVGADTSGLKKGLEEAGKQLGNAEQKMRTLDGTSRQADKGMGGLGATIGKLAVALGAAKLGNMALELGALGAEAQRTEASFVGVAGGADKAAAMLDALKAATNGTKSEVELMNGATTIMALGLGKTADEIGTIMRNVEALGSRFGGNMQTFQLMMSNDSLMRIDSFGIGVEEATKRIEEYKAAGMDASKAFDTAVMELMTEKFNSLGGVVDDNKASIDRMKASLQDLKVEIGQGLAPTIGTLATNMGDLARLTNRAAKEYGSAGWQIADMIVEAFDVFDIIPTAIDKMEKLEAAEREIAEAIAKGNAAQGQGFRDVGAAATIAEKALANYDTSAYQVYYNMRNLRTESLGLADVTYDSAAAWRDYTNAINGAAPAQYAATQAAASARLAFLNEAAALDEMNNATFVSSALDGLALSTEAMADATDALLTRFGLLTPAEKEAQGLIEEFSRRLEQNKIGPEQYADALWDLKAAIDGLYDKEITIKVKYNESELKGPPGSGLDTTPDAPYVPPATPPAEVPHFAAGGFLPLGDYGIVGEGGGPEMIYATSSGVAIEPLTGSGGALERAAVGVPQTVEINIYDARDPEATASVVLRRLQDRGLIRAGGYR